ncbi:MAG: hypothetical protein FK733_07135 [Asgard group archaeon]|nr:hypothetical protein [Asgard group archaeon]
MRRKSRIFRNTSGYCLWPFAVFFEFFRIFFMKDSSDDTIARCCCNCACDACCQDSCGRRRSCIRCG